ncbi:hypothetical protein V8E36_009911 [Tilletia maclaganii]
MAANPNSPASAAMPNYEVLFLTVKATVPFAIRNLCIQIAFSSAVITLYIFLLFLSSPHHRATWTFALVSFITALFFVTAFTNSIQLTHSLSQPEIKNPIGIEFTDAFITLCLPWFADWIIFLRAIALVPPRERREHKWLILAAIVLFIKLTRGGFLIYLCYHLHSQMKDSMTPADLGTKVWPIAGSTWVEYAGMLVDTTICSAVCTLRLRSLMKPSRSETRSKALQERLRLLLLNTLSSFIFPVISTVVMIILAAVSTFEAYASAPKVNSGIVTMNVLIAMLIPIIDSSVAEKRSAAQRELAITDSFLRKNHKSRTLSVSGGPHQHQQLSGTPALNSSKQQQQGRGFAASPGLDKKLEMESRAAPHYFSTRRVNRAGIEHGDVGVADDDVDLHDDDDNDDDDTQRPSGLSSSSAAAAARRAVPASRRGRGNSTDPESYEPSMVEKTPVLEFREVRGTHVGLGQHLGYNGSNLSLPAVAGGGGGAAAADGGNDDVERQQRRSELGSRPFVSMTQSPLSVDGSASLPSPHQPDSASTTQQQQQQQLQTRGESTQPGLAPARGNSVARSTASAGPGPGSGAGRLLPAAYINSYADGTSPQREDGPLATTDEHRVRLRSMPRRQRP